MRGLPAAPPGVRRRLVPAFCAVALLGALAGPARAQDWLLVEGLVDGEAWKTGPEGRLARNDGGLAGQGRLYLWMAAEATPELSFYFLGELESEFEGGGETETELEQLFVRYSPGARAAFSVEAGRITSPAGGAFARRHLSYRNPLIGGPYTYDVSYPDGIKLFGSVARFDYQAAWVDLPLTSGYAPEPTPVFRPALGAGVTPFTGLRIGVSYTSGPYLNDHLGVAIAPGEDWKSFDQSVIGGELQFSRGYFELNAEFVRASYEVPMEPQLARGKAYYAEAKYTWTPRLFTALRVGRYAQPYIRPAYLDYWSADEQRFLDAEVGLGYRVTGSTLLKVSYWRDWPDDAAGSYPVEDGGAWAFQISHRFDVKSWVDGPR